MATALPWFSPRIQEDHELSFVATLYHNPKRPSVREDFELDHVSLVLADASGCDDAECATSKDMTGANAG